LQAEYGFDGCTGRLGEAAGGPAAVHLVGGNLHEARDAQLAGGVQQHLSAAHVRPHHRLRVLDRAVDVRLGGEVVDQVAAFHDLADDDRIADVAAHELVAWIVLHRRQVLQIAGVGQLVEDDDAAVARLRQQQLHEVAADESGATGDQDPHSRAALRGPWAQEPKQS
jgi:hypothetical protein